MASKPAISVIMSVYNGARYLYPAAQSILAQDSNDFEFLIVDDGSTDSSCAILREIAAVDKRVTLIERENRGLVTSLNELIMLAKAPLLARMDCDDIAMPDRFSKQVEFMAAHSDVGILGCNTLEIDERGRITLPQEHYLDYPDMEPDRLLEGPPVCHPSVMMRTDLIRDLGGYRTTFTHAEDYELWLRASTSCRIANLPERLLLYRRSEFQVSEVYRFEQAKAAAVAWQNHVRQLAGKSDLFIENRLLSNIYDLDSFFDAKGTDAAVRQAVVERMRYSPEFLQGKGFELMSLQARSGKGFQGAARTIFRLARIGELRRALTLACYLAFPVK